FAPRVAACPLSEDECAGVVRDLAQLPGDQLERLRRGERVLEVRDLVGEGSAHLKEISGALVVAAPPAVAWNVITDFRSWPQFIPHLAKVTLGPITHRAAA